MYSLADRPRPYLPTARLRPWHARGAQLLLRRLLINDVAMGDGHMLLHAVNLGAPNSTLSHHGLFVGAPCRRVAARAPLGGRKHNSFSVDRRRRYSEPILLDNRRAGPMSRMRDKCFVETHSQRGVVDSQGQYFVLNLVHLFCAAIHLKVDLHSIDCCICSPIWAVAVGCRNSARIKCM